MTNVKHVRLGLVVALLLVASGEAIAQTGALGPKDGAGLRPTEIERVGVGSAAPDFTLTSKEGAPVTLSGFRGKKDVVLVFYRGSW